MVFTLTAGRATPFWDCGEFIACAYILGIPHPPGAALFVMMGRVISLIPLGEVAFKLNLFSVYSSAFAVGFCALSLARVIRHLLETQPVLIWSFFFGLVLASIIYVAKKITRWYPGTVILLIAGAALAYFITTLTPQEAEVTYPFVFLSGALAICAMILPGISGSFILLLLGMYKPVLDAIHYRDLGVIVVLMAGAVVGLLSFSRLLLFLL